MKRAALLFLSVMALSAAACELPVDGGEDYREPVPAAEEVTARLSGPSAGERLITYDYVRDFTNDVDAHTGALSALVWDIVHTPPGRVQGKTAVWGPVKRPGFAAEWRVSVTDTGGMEFDYILEGRRPGFSSEKDYELVLRGHGFARAHARHHAGWVTVEHDALHRIEPDRGGSTGTTTVRYDNVKGPGGLTIEARPKQTRRWVDLTIARLEEGGGELEMKGLDDFSREGFDLEDLVVRGRWGKSGAGRADVLVFGGGHKTPSKISECWSQSYSRVYVKKNEQASGNASSCAFQEPGL
jgi:hypothetical protein